MTKRIKVKLVHGTICCPPNQRSTVKGLGLARIGQERWLVDTPQARGMVATVPHLVRIVEERAS